MKRSKIGLVGAGNVGGTLAHLTVLEKLGDIVLFDIAEGIPQGKALDIAQCGPLTGFDFKIIGTNDYKDLEGCDVVVVTAGLPRKPGMSRDDLLEVNNKVMKSVGEGIKNNCPEAFVICVTNPIDVMVGQLQKYSGVPDNMITGMAGVLDSARFSRFLSEEFKVSVDQVKAFVIGGHGDTMVPLTGMSNIAGVTLESLIEKGFVTRERVNKIIERTQKAGGEIVAHLKTASAYYTPATAVIAMMKAYMRDKHNIFPCAVKVTKQEYGIKKPIFVGLPTKISGKGVEEIIEIPLTEDERNRLDISIKNVVELNEAVAKISFELYLN